MCRDLSAPAKNAQANVLPNGFKLFPANKEIYDEKLYPGGYQLLQAAEIYDFITHPEVLPIRFSVNAAAIPSQLLYGETPNVLMEDDTISDVVSQTVDVAEKLDVVMCHVCMFVDHDGTKLQCYIGYTYTNVFCDKFLNRFRDRHGLIYPKILL